ncbi:MAG: cell division protein FtsQ/DivIB [Alphaproteobacteria bacterium]
MNEKFYPIDGDGKVIDANFRTQEPILLIVGAGAPENLKRLLEAIKDDGDTYLQRIKVANFISQRRWNLILDDIKEGLRSSFPRRILKTPGKNC